MNNAHDEKFVEVLKCQNLSNCNCECSATWRPLDVAPVVLQGAVFGQFCTAHAHKLENAIYRFPIKIMAW